MSFIAKPIGLKDFSILLMALKKYRSTWSETTDKRTDVSSRPSCINTQIFSPPKIVFPHEKYFSIFLSFVYLYSMQIFSADPKIFSTNFWIYFLSIKTLKNGPQKLLIIGLNPFISQSSPNHSPQPRIDFSYYEISGPDICFLICVWIIDESR